MELLQSQPQPEPDEDGPSASSVHLSPRDVYEELESLKEQLSLHIEWKEVTFEPEEEDGKETYEACCSTVKQLQVRLLDFII